MALPDKRQFLGGAIAAALLPRAAQARTITDMAGRQMQVPSPVRRVYVQNDPPAIFITSIAPDLLVGFSFPVSTEGKHFLPPSVTRLPFLGGAARLNPERLLALNIDVAIGWNAGGPPDMFSQQVMGMGKPVIMVDAMSCRQYPASFRFLGALLGREARAERLARWMEASQARLDATVGRIPDAKRLRVYYADTVDGLQSSCATAFRGGEEIKIAGGHDILSCTVPDSIAASVSINLETLLAHDPDVLVVRAKAGAHHIRREPGWRALRAVRTGRVYTYPELPFSWAERPHSQFKFLAMEWLANKLYPHIFPFDFAARTREFFQLFYGKELTDNDIARLQA